MSLERDEECPRCNSPGDLVYMDDLDFTICLLCGYRFVDAEKNNN